jgi:hypothetical protein
MTNETHENDQEITDKITHAGEIGIGKEAANFM